MAAVETGSKRSHEEVEEEDPYDSEAEALAEYKRQRMEEDRQVAGIATSTEQEEETVLYSYAQEPFNYDESDRESEL